VLDRSTLAHWTGSAAELLQPLHARLLEKLKGSGKLFADETRAPVLGKMRSLRLRGALTHLCAAGYAILVSTLAASSPLYVCSA